MEESKEEQRTDALYDGIYDAELDDTADVYPPLDAAQFPQDSSQFLNARDTADNETDDGTAAATESAADASLDAGMGPGQPNLYWNPWLAAKRAKAAELQKKKDYIGSPEARKAKQKFLAKMRKQREEAAAKKAQEQGEHSYRDVPASRALHTSATSHSHATARASSRASASSSRSAFAFPSTYVHPATHTPHEQAYDHMPVHDGVGSEHTASRSQLSRQRSLSPIQRRQLKEQQQEQMLQQSRPEWDDSFAVTALNASSKQQPPPPVPSALVRYVLPYNRIPLHTTNPDAFLAKSNALYNPTHLRPQQAHLQASSPVPRSRSALALHDQQSQQHRAHAAASALHRSSSKQSVKQLERYMFGAQADQLHEFAPYSRAQIDQMADSLTDQLQLGKFSSDEATRQMYEKYARGGKAKPLRSKGIKEKKPIEEKAKALEKVNKLWQQAKADFAGAATTSKSHSHSASAANTMHMPPYQQVPASAAYYPPMTGNTAAYAGAPLPPLPYGTSTTHAFRGRPPLPATAGQQQQQQYGHTAADMYGSATDGQSVRAVTFHGDSLPQFEAAQCDHHSHKNASAAPSSAVWFDAYRDPGMSNQAGSRTGSAHSRSAATGGLHHSHSTDSYASSDSAAFAFQPQKRLQPLQS